MIPFKSVLFKKCWFFFCSYLLQCVRCWGIGFDLLLWMLSEYRTMIFLKWLSPNVLIFSHLYHINAKSASLFIWIIFGKCQRSNFYGTGSLISILIIQQKIKNPKNPYFYLVLFNIKCIFVIRSLQIIVSKLYFHTSYWTNYIPGLISLTIVIQ